ncbi:hypothetical protein VNO78_23850 [Psophocarpus tetragonolobus]|uniref:Uncharacterized protein n=1 Tax=Psophocarpus tetragonolobus TaxID=3891 RepID=A0AAN9S7F9_PSOTE
MLVVLLFDLIIAGPTIMLLIFEFHKTLPSLPYNYIEAFHALKLRIRLKCFTDLAHFSPPKMRRETDPP